MESVNLHLIGLPGDVGLASEVEEAVLGVEAEAVGVAAGEGVAQVRPAVLVLCPQVLKCPIES